MEIAVIAAFGNESGVKVIINATHAPAWMRGLVYTRDLLQLRRLLLVRERGRTRTVTHELVQQLSLGRG